MLPAQFLFCRSTNPQSILAFTTFKVKEYVVNYHFLPRQSVNVETYGKGKKYQRTEPVVTEHNLEEFRIKFGLLFHDFSRHIVPAWFLSNTKMEIMRPLQRRLCILFAVTDFAENVVATRKYELAEQHFHQTEILLFGAVVSLAETDENGKVVLHQYSFMVSSDFRLSA